MISVSQVEEGIILYVPKLGPQRDPCGLPLVIFFSILLLLIDITALLSLK